jgi:hypothetical protein
MRNVRAHTIAPVVRAISRCVQPSADEHDYLEPVSVDECAQHVSEICACALGVSVDVAVIRDHISPLCTSILEPSIILAKTIDRSIVMDEIAGQKLAKRVRAHVYCADVGADVSDTGDPLADAVAEVVLLRKQMVQLKAAASCGRMDTVRSIVGDSMVLTSAKPSLGSWRANKEEALMIAKHDLTTLVLAFTHSFKHAPATVGMVRALDRMRSHTSTCVCRATDA